MVDVSLSTVLYNEYLPLPVEENMFVRRRLKVTNSKGLRHCGSLGGEHCKHMGTGPVRFKVRSDWA